MTHFSKSKWLVVLGVALALPATGVLTGCSGGNGSNFNLGGGSQSSPFAGLQAQGGVVSNAQGDPIGTFGFNVAADGTITATLNSDLFDAQNAARKARRAIVTGTGNVNSTTGFFEIVFHVSVEGQPRTITFSGYLSQNGASFTATDLHYVVTDNAGNELSNGTFGELQFSVVGGGGEGSANGTFNVSGGNAISGSLTSNAGAAFVTSLNNKKINVVASFTEATSSGARTINVGATDPNGLQTGTFSIANDEGTVIYTEVPVANPAATKYWRATSGTVKVTRLTETEVDVEISNVTLAPESIPNNPASGNLSASGSGTATIGSTPL